MCLHIERKRLLFPAHLRDDGIIQTVAQHCRETAEIASKALGPLGLSTMAKMAGLMHDAGKTTDKYKTYITEAAAGRPVRRGSVNHTFAGVQYMLKTFHGLIMVLRIKSTLLPRTHKLCPSSTTTFPASLNLAH